MGTGHDFMLSWNNINPDMLKKFKTSEDIFLNHAQKMAFNKTYYHIMKKVKSKYKDFLIEKNLDRDNIFGNPIMQYLINNSEQSDVVIQRSIVGQQYNWHSDFVHPKLDGLGGGMRILTCILYLNDMEDDAGGCTEFYMW